jgi:CDP-diacylglycerol--serine O-phosphatidyltransferase
MSKINFLTKQVPNILTLLNMAAGSVALILALESNLTASAILILIAALLDFADGMAARLLDAGSALGKQLDSLSDLVSFCVAPSVILYFLISKSMPISENIPIRFADSLLMLLPVSPVFLILAGGYRLARFNIKSSTENFYGLPVPASGIFISGLALMAADSPGGFPAVMMHWPWFYFIVIIFLCVLMISSLHLLSLKFATFTYRNNQVRYLFLVTSAVLLVVIQESALPLIIITYLLFSLINNLLLKQDKRT